MIKLINYKNHEKGQIVFINKSCIGGMVRDEQKELTCVWDNGVTESASYEFKETPEEILAMPDIEESGKAIDWEQRRYEIAMHILSQSFTLGRAEDTVTNALYYAYALIRELKKGDEK